MLLTLEGLKSEKTRKWCKVQASPVFYWCNHCSHIRQIEAKWKHIPKTFVSGGVTLIDQMQPCPTNTTSPIRRGNAFKNMVKHENEHFPIGKAEHMPFFQRTYKGKLCKEKKRQNTRKFLPESPTS
jgi:pyruvate/2-oxoacid:ferredoxin oxidoreductase beta subunit